MAKLFNRKCVLIAGKQPPDNFVQVVPDSLRIENLRIDFDIEKDDKPQPNRSKISVYNLNEIHRGQLNEKGIRVILQAGYEDTVAQIFSGDARYINSERMGPDWVTKFECGDSERAFKFAEISESFNPGATAKDILGSVVKQLQADPGNLMKVADNITRSFPHGHVAHGNAAEELTRILEPAGYSWSFQDGRVEVLKSDEAINGEEVNVPLISEKTGMVGSPEFGTGDRKKGPATLKVKSLLQPRIHPGSKFQLQSRNKSGFYRATKVKHQGSTHGVEWFTDIEATVFIR